MTDQQQKTLVHQLFNVEAEHWTRWAYDPQETFELFPTGNARRFVIEKELFRQFGDKKIAMFDAGCGSGDLAIGFLQSGYDVVGADFAPAMIDICRSQYQAAFPSRGDALDRFFVADVEKLTPHERQFDCVYAVGLFEYLETDEPFFAAAHQRLESNGVLFVECRNRLFNALSGNSYSVLEAQAGAFPELVSELEAGQRFSPLPDKAVATILTSTMSQADKLFKLAGLESERKDEGIKFPTGITRRQFTPSSLEQVAAKSGFNLSHVIYYHMHLLPPRFEREFPQFYNALSMALQPLGETALGAYIGSCFLAVLRKSEP